MTMRVGFAESDTRTAYRRHPTWESASVTDEATITGTGATGSPEGVAKLAERGMGELADKMGMVITELSAERAVGTIPVEGNRQPVGLLHGGAFVVLAESL